MGTYATETVNLTNFQNMNALHGHVPVRDFYEIFSICGHFFHGLTIQIWGFAQGVLEL